MIKLCQLSGKKLYPHPILKDLFDFIDLRKDGYIDIHEWMQTFQIPESVKIKLIY